MADHNFNSYLQYTDDQTGIKQTYRMWTMEYTQPHTLAGADSQSKMYKHFYPRSYSPGEIAVTGRVPLQKDYDNLGEFVRKHHLVLMRSSGLSNVGIGAQLPLMRLAIPNEGIYVEGILKSFQAGAKRFAVAPQFTFNFTVVKDSHSKNANMNAGYALRNFWTGTFIDQGATINDVTNVDNAPITSVLPQGKPGTN